ncbi:ribbon-helix-helix domain-containing protein [Calycomorphotria hydatis]|nr:type II toxin-antitoxin system ParD family antitoxin [Calycomorphotria hydatis]
MNIQISSETEQLIQEELSSGGFTNADDVVREALRALSERREREATVADVMEGWNEYQSGQGQPLDQADEEIRASLGLPPRNA